MIVIGAGLFYSLIIFFICEEKSLKNANISDMTCMLKEDVDVGECFEKYNTVRYMLYYFFAVFIFAALVAYYVHIPNNFGLGEILAYAFLPSLFGSLIILLVKWKFQPMIKIISSFMFGAGYMAATAFAFALVYAING
jgi:magnesium-transporting ATPase (P-type)